MARYRLSPLAEADLIGILAASSRQWGADGQRRYAALLAAAMRKIAAEPEGTATRSREELRPGIRSFHLRHARSGGFDGQSETPGPCALLPRGRLGSDRDRAGIARAHGAEPAPVRGFGRPIASAVLRCVRSLRGGGEVHRVAIGAGGIGGVGAVVEAGEQVGRLAGDHDDRPGGAEAHDLVGSEKRPAGQVLAAAGGRGGGFEGLAGVARAVGGFKRDRELAEGIADVMRSVVVSSPKILLRGVG